MNEADKGAGPVDPDNPKNRRGVDGAPTIDESWPDDPADEGADNFLDESLVPPELDDATPEETCGSEYCDDHYGPPPYTTYVCTLDKVHTGQRHTDETLGRERRDGAYVQWGLPQPAEGDVLYQDPNLALAPDLGEVVAQGLPEPIEADNPEDAIRNLIGADSVRVLRQMVDGLEAGLEDASWNPVRALYLIGAYADNARAQMAELDGNDEAEYEDDNDNEGYGGMLYAPQRGRRGRRARRGGGMAQNFPIHGGADEPGRQIMGVLGGMVEKTQAKDESARLRSLMSALESAVRLEDDQLQTSIRAQLNELMPPALDSVPNPPKEP